MGGETLHFKACGLPALLDPTAKCRLPCTAPHLNTYITDPSACAALTLVRLRFLPCALPSLLTLLVYCTLHTQYHTHGCTLPHPADQSFVNTVQKVNECAKPILNIVYRIYSVSEESNKNLHKRCQVSVIVICISVIQDTIDEECILFAMV